MSVKIRLAKTGKTHNISYRLVAQDTRSKRDGRFLEILGFYLPNSKDLKKGLSLKQDKINFWLSKGAKPTIAVEKLLKGDFNIKTPKKEKLAKVETQANTVIS